MKKQDKVEAAVVKAKANWRRVCDSPDSSAGDRRTARAMWKKAQVERDRAFAIWRAELIDRRKAAADRRKTAADRRNANADRAREQADRRKTSRRPSA